MTDSKVKEYVLRIVYNTETGEILHLSEYTDLGCSLDVDGESVSVSEDLQKELEKIDHDILGLA
tara:strand:- start:466 stop:657 length:192 start_codon:yes stop_codon:yes gene_type:complete